MMGCYRHIFSYTNLASRTPAIAIITIGNSGRANLAVCKIHLDEWFDKADDYPALEPLKVEWLR